MEIFDPALPLLFPCDHCGGTGKGDRFDDSCYYCKGGGSRPEPKPTAGVALRRWVLSAHVLLSQPGSSGSQVDAILGGAFGVASVSGTLGQLREHGIAVKDTSKPVRYTLTSIGEQWTRVYCRECLQRAPKHRKSCSQPQPGNSGAAPAGDLFQEDGPSALSSLVSEMLDSNLELLAIVDLGDGEARISSDAGRVELELGARSFSPEAAVVLGEALVRAGQAAKSAPTL